MPAEFLQSSLLAKADVLRHGFFTRRGGVSGGIYESLNCGLGSRDRPEDVLANRRACLAAIGAEAAALCGVYQIHSAEVARLDAPWGPLPDRKADAIVTRQKNIAISILTADCAPVLFADPGNGVIGAAHAGWQGAVGGVLENTVAAMEELGAERSAIIAAIGPCIAQASYEVGPEFRARLLEAVTTNDAWFRPSERSDHFMFDLQGYVGQRLRDTGIGRIDCLDRDTYSEEDLFYSYRRTTHKKEEDYGRQISLIMLA